MARNLYTAWRRWLQRRRVARCNAIMAQYGSQCANPADHYPLRWPFR